MGPERNLCVQEEVMSLLRLLSPHPPSEDEGLRWKREDEGEGGTRPEEELHLKEGRPGPLLCSGTGT